MTVRVVLKGRTSGVLRTEFSASRPGIVKLIHGMSNGDSTDSSLIVSFTLDSCSTRVYCALTALR